MENLNDLLSDLAGYHTCDRLKDELMRLRGDKKEREAGDAPVVGMFRFMQCRTFEINDYTLQIDVKGAGWQWIERKKKKMGAVFRLSENVKFNVYISMQGTFDAAYDRDQHIATAWFVLTEPVEVRIEVVNDVEVETHDIWSSFVEEVASVFIGSADALAIEAIQDKAEYKFKSKLKNGLSLVVDLCTGRRYAELGNIEAGRIPDDSGTTEAEGILEDNEAIMHGENLLMTEPYTIAKPLSARVSVVDGGEVHSAFVCEKEAMAMAEAYLNDEPLTADYFSDEGTATPQADAVFNSGEAVDCPLIFVMRTVKENRPTRLRYTLRGNEVDPTPLMECPKE